jgi:hypothetical protein
MHLIVACRSRVNTIYGSDSFSKLASALTDYGLALSNVVPHELLIVDDAASAALCGVNRLETIDATSVASSIRAARTAAGNPITSVLLVGGPDVIPLFCLPNTVNPDDDSMVQSDNPYGCATDDERTFMTPDLPVGRAVGTADGGVASLMAHLSAMAGLHRTMRSASGAFGLGCSVWSSFTNAVLQNAGQPTALRTSPSFVIDSTTATDLNRRLIYFNLHGTRTDAVWRGEDERSFYDAVAPGDLGAADLNGCIVFAANCYGAAVQGRTSANSCALMAIQRGVRTFVGSTCFSFGAGSHSYSEPLFSDRLAQLFFNRCANGDCSGEALVNARISYVEENLIGTVLNPRERKTSLQFIFLGDPTL